MNIDSDKPLENPDQDLLGYAPFAEQLAKSIHLMPEEGAVVAIYGSWGLGKTSTLNLIKYYLQEQESPKITIVNFNPWWFSGQEDLTLRFFGALNEAISAFGNENITNLLLDFAQIASKANAPWWLQASSEVLDQVKKKCIEEYALIDKKRKALENALQKQTNKILVIIDDIDRLTAEETRQIFKLVKSVANLPNVIYLLAFDESVVAKALQGTQLIPGREYLKKIVQVPFELPYPEKSQIASLLFKHLDSLLTNAPKMKFDQDRWYSIFSKGIQYYIDTPRDVIRLINSLNVTYGCVHDEVNPVDFVAIETIRVFAPDTYDLIRKNSSLFFGHSSDDQESKFDFKSLPTMKPEEDSALKCILIELFPKLKSIGYSSDWLTTWRKDLRICSPDCFPIYFRLTVPTGATSNADIQHLLTLTRSPKKFAELLIQQSGQKGINGHTHTHGLLLRLGDHIDQDINEEDIPNIIAAFFLAGDRLLSPEDQKLSFWDTFGSADSIWWIISRLLSRIPQSERLEIIERGLFSDFADDDFVWLVYNTGDEGVAHGVRLLFRQYSLA